METLRYAAPDGDSQQRTGSPRVAEVTLQAEDRNVPAARAFTAATLARWGVTAPDAELLVTELASNAIRAARKTLWPQILVRVSRTAGGVLLEVGDKNASPPVIAAPQSSGAEHGRGLLLVARLAAAYGWYTDADCKFVWAEAAALGAARAAGHGAAAAGRAA